MNLVWKVFHTNRKDFNIDDTTHKDVVTHVHWRCEASDDNHPSYEDRVAGTLPFDILEMRYVNKRGEEIVSPAQFDPNNYIPYKDLSEEVMVQWVKDFLGTQEVNRVEQVLRDRYPF